MINKKTGRESEGASEAGIAQHPARNATGAAQCTGLGSAYRMPPFSCFTWNISFEAVACRRNRVGVESQVGTRYSPNHPGPPVQIYQPDQVPCVPGDARCRDNIASVLISGIQQHDVTVVIEAYSHFFKRHVYDQLPRDIQENKTFLRFTAPENSEVRCGEEAIIIGFPRAWEYNRASLFDFHWPRFRRGQQRGLQNRPLAVVVFNNPRLVLVAVHQPHPNPPDVNNDALLMNQALYRCLQQYVPNLRDTHLLVTGDFNNQLDMPELRNARTPNPTSFTIVEERWPDMPMSFWYDRFVCGHLEPHNPQALHYQMAFSGYHSDHLPVRCQFRFINGPRPPPMIADQYVFPRCPELTYCPDGVEPIRPNSEYPISMLDRCQQDQGARKRPRQSGPDQTGPKPPPPAGDRKNGKKKSPFVPVKGGSSLFRQFAAGINQ